MAIKFTDSVRKQRVSQRQSLVPGVDNREATEPTVSLAVIDTFYQTIMVNVEQRVALSEVQPIGQSLRAGSLTYNAQLE